MARTSELNALFRVAELSVLKAPPAWLLESKMFATILSYMQSHPLLLLPCDSLWHSMDGSTLQVVLKSNKHGGEKARWCSCVASGQFLLRRKGGQTGDEDEQDK